MRYLIEIAYKGTNYHGWQIQNNANSIQATLQKALSTILREAIEIVGSSRTDTGVHATQQFAHFDSIQILTKNSLQKFNSLLHPDIIIKNIYPVANDFHARFEAIARSYEYRIALERTPFLQKLCYFSHKIYNIDLMNEACKILIETEDFQSFSKVHTDVPHFLCTIQEAYWESIINTNYGNIPILVFHITANRFLRGMVRALVGTLLEVGLGKISLADLEKIIVSKDRSKASSAVPAEGLFLTQVKYPFLENKLA